MCVCGFVFFFTFYELVVYDIFRKYYFSATNLAQDEHFCGLMNSRGFVNIDEILKFAQMQRIGASTDDLVKLTIESSDLELSRDQFRIRTKQWRSFTPNPVMSCTF